MPYLTREDWLTEGARRIIDIFVECGYTMPKIRISCSWPGGASPNKRIGECWSRNASADGTNEIFISPIIADPVAALDILTHEMVHAVDDCVHGHRREFTAIGRKIGLTGKPTSMHAAPELRARLTAIAADLGHYPHAKLEPALAGRKKQTSRQLKHECTDCGAIWRMAGKWQATQCPCCGSLYLGPED